MASHSGEVEATERAALVDLHAAADDGRRDDLGLRTHEVGSALASIGAALLPSAIAYREAYVREDYAPPRN